MKNVSLAFPRPVPCFFVLRFAASYLLCGYQGFSVLRPVRLKFRSNDYGKAVLCLFCVCQCATIGGVSRLQGRNPFPKSPIFAFISVVRAFSVERSVALVADKRQGMDMCKPS